MKIFRLKGKIQHYGWGGYDFLPNLLGIENGKKEPFAELWMGTHHKGPSVLVKGEEEINLSDFISQNPSEVLGTRAAKNFDNQLPFLFKILDVNQMLSIQAHPTKKEAEKGFKKENEIGIALTARNRNYRDDNHKPEIMVALTDFWLLHGFQSEEKIGKALQQVPEFEELQDSFKEKSIFNLYKKVMEMSQAEVNEMLRPLKKRLLPLFEAGKLEKTSADYWAGLAFKQDILNNGHEDRGIFSIYFFNLVNIKKGGGIFQDAGVPHAYLEGVNVELMANSDNVFRGGLTYKHIDVPELLKHLVFDAITPTILNGTVISPMETVFKTPAPDFELSKIEIEEEQNYQSTNAEAASIVIVTEGNVRVGEEEYQTGEIFFAPARINYLIESEQAATLFKATVPNSF